MATSLILLKHQTENSVFPLVYSITVLVLLFAYALWDRQYRRKWQQSRAKRWQKVEGEFDEGEVITMLKGRSKTIAGYEVSLGYEYQADGEQGGVYYLPEMKTKEEAETALKLLANKTIVVRVAPGRPDRSRVVDEDLAVLLPKAFSQLANH
jgi:hypothetical protein